jgi:PAS domain S-box-containing protein
MTTHHLTGRERFFDPSDLIVSKTDLRGRIVYANRQFQSLAGYDEKELIGASHSIVRHPDMPRAVFKMLWEAIVAGREIFAYVINRSENGDHYWVFAHVTPSFGADGVVNGYHSSRRVPRRDALDRVVPLYTTLCAIERGRENPKAGLAASMAAVETTVRAAGMAYEEFVHTL